jgi:hypothetical protein
MMIVARYMQGDMAQIFHRDGEPRETILEAFLSIFFRNKILNAI